MALILLHSPKGGVGTTTLAANLALMLASRGRDVVAADFSPQDSLKLHFGFRPDQTLASASRSDEAQVVAGVRVLGCNRPEDLADPVAAIRPWLGEGSMVIADIAAGGGETFRALLPSAALHLCALTTDAASLAVLPQLAAGRSFIAATTAQNSLFVLNQVDERRRLGRDAAKFLRRLVGDRLIGVIRRDEAVNEALAMMEPLSKFAPTSAAAADFIRFGDTIRELPALRPPVARNGADDAAIRA
ncbi:cellulose synthase operon protein YhjQ/BcsQ [Flavisphingomonas formosensis]|uniref:cellulose synthase operon protein YhjQ/BcsQ n=1 Tax=Flavisphingomonas formosensis TaxID=861534 RepID=UPI0012F8915A|nr:cellulose synthase operon protein YhjQ/BcsQ [Sphingomonas formosensis]